MSNNDLLCSKCKTRHHPAYDCDGKHEAIEWIIANALAMYAETRIGFSFNDIIPDAKQRILKVIVAELEKLKMVKQDGYEYGFNAGVEACIKVIGNL